MRLIALVAVVALVAPQQPPLPGIFLERLTWTEAEPLLTPETVVVIPVGAASKEHGPHLKLRNDLTLAEYLTRRVAEKARVVIAPTVPYNYYPAFLDYPGSTSLSLDTSRQTFVEIAKSLAAHGPRRFYVLNTGISTVFPLSAAAKALANDGVLLHYTELGPILEDVARGVRQQEGGTHADEMETSAMLFIDPAAVDMRKAVKDFSPASRPFRLTRKQGEQGTYSPTGIWGDPRLATQEKGRVIVEALVEGILSDIETLRGTKPPAPSATPPPASPAPARPGPPQAPAPARPASCTGGEDRSIQMMALRYNSYWTQQDYDGLASLFAPEADIVHPDGTVERLRVNIRENRRQLFLGREYRGSRHPLTVGAIRCLSENIALVDGKWELRGVVDANNKDIPAITGLFTTVLRRSADTPWAIEAYRYTINKPPDGTVPPTLLRRPGYPDIIK